MSEVHSYSCDRCGLASQPVASIAEMSGLRDTHDRLVHGHMSGGDSDRKGRARKARS
ncbi:hypothetical protein [Frankia sp. R43]|uniref:hypothetical protein n=1 Tax=Frankia sp. R43 TaxID=269536 RepID=UPI000B0F8D7F|nr:hypothetical protein [Frankia sp. R43]